VRLELERIKSQRSEEAQKTTSLLTEDRIASPKPSTSATASGSTPAPSSAPVPGFPVIDLTQPPPGYPPLQYPHGYGQTYPTYDKRFEQDYDDKVRRFLQETGGLVPDKRDRHHSSRDKHRRSRSRNRSRSRRSRERESSSKKKKKTRRSSRSKSSERKPKRKSGSKEKILMDDDDFAKKLSDHLSGSGGERKKSTSRSREKSRKTRRSNSRSRDRSREKRKERGRSGSRGTKGQFKEEKGESKVTGGWHSVGQEQAVGVGDTWQEERDRRKSNSAKPMANVFGSDEEQEMQEKKKKKSEPKKVPTTGGMWIPTGEDSILDGVKVAISKLEEKQRYGARSRDEERWDPNRKIKMTAEAPPPSSEYSVTFDSRTGMYIRVPKQPEPLTMAEKIAASKVTQMDREKAKDRDVQEVEERIVRKLSNSPPRLPTKRKPTPSVGRRSSSKEKRSGRSRSRERRRSDRRSRSRSRRRRSRSRGRRSRSRRRSRSKSRDHRKSHSRSRSRNRSKKDRTSFDKTNTIQQEISGMREETRRLQSEREAIEREKALLLAGPSSSNSTGQTRPL